MTDKDFVYSRMGMALVSAQRVEFVTGKLLELLKEFDASLYGVTTKEFLSSSAKAKTERITMGGIFKLLKLNANLVISDELDAYLNKRNILAHSFFKEYLQEYSALQIKKALDFCYEFGRHSDNLERFFKGFVVFLALRHVKDVDELDDNLKAWTNDLNYFVKSLKANKL